MTHRHRLPQPDVANAAEKPSNRRSALRTLWTAAVGAGLGGASGCGGGGDAADAAPLQAPAPDKLPLGGVDSGGTGRPMSSFFSVALTATQPLAAGSTTIDAGAASVVDGDGAALPAAALSVGMTAQVDGTRASGDGTAPVKASSIVVAEQGSGLAMAAQSAGDGFSLNGQPVAVNAATVFDGLGTLPPVGLTVRVWGQLDLASHRIVASRVDRPDPGADWVLRGLLEAVDPAAGTLRIAGVVLQVADAALLGSTPPPGALVRARIDPASGLLRGVRDDALRLPDRDEAELEGRVTQPVSALHFGLDGVVVDATALGAAALAGVVPGARVHARGRSRNGRLLASSLQVENDAGDTLQELEGRISSVQPALRSFVLQGVTVTWDATTRFEGGTARQLMVRRKVAVKGRFDSRRLVLAARLIHVER